MKILHINTGQEGGAALCARRINNALVQAGVESKMLFAEGNCMPDGIKGAIAVRDKDFWYSNPILAKVKHLLMRMPWYYDEEKMRKMLVEANKEHLYLHQPYSSYKNIAHHPLVEWADIIHLHWVPDFVDYPTFFKEVKKPIVWTLHDMLPAIGVMHYESNFTVLPEYLKTINRISLDIKARSLKCIRNLHCVAISEMMIPVCQESEVLKFFPCSLIHNGVDTELFKSYNVNRQEIIDKYQSLKNNRVTLNEGMHIIMFISYEIMDKRKGLDRVIRAIEMINKKNDILLLVVGLNYEKKDPQASFPIITTGLIKDPKELAQLYSTADYFISASYEETYGQTTTEAMACGTPVISTATGIAQDLIRPFNGVICSGYTPEDLKQGIEQALITQYNREEIRNYIVQEYDYSKIAKEYVALYERVLNDENQSESHDR